MPGLSATLTFREATAEKLLRLLKNSRQFQSTRHTLLMSSSLSKLPLVFILLLLPALAAETPCSFQSIGDPRNGLLFVAETTRSDLTVRSALGQFQQIALDGGYELGNELLTGNSGKLSFLQTSNSPALVMWVNADQTGKVTLSVKLARDQKADAAGVKAEFCAMLGKLKSGPEGEALATAARARSHLDRAIAVDAVALAADLGGEVKRTLAATASKGKLGRFLIGSGTYATSGEYQEVFAPIEAKYLGRKYEIDGQIYTVARNTITNEMQLNYLVTPRRGLLGVKQNSEFNNLHFQISCTLASDQAAFYSTLTEGNWVKLVGTVTAVRPGGLELTECRRAN